MDSPHGLKTSTGSPCYTEPSVICLLRKVTLREVLGRPRPSPGPHPEWPPQLCFLLFLCHRQTLPPRAENIRSLMVWPFFRLGFWERRRLYPIWNQKGTPGWDGVGAALRMCRGSWLAAGGPESPSPRTDSPASASEHSTRLSLDAPQAPVRPASPTRLSRPAPSLCAGTHLPAFPTFMIRTGCFYLGGGGGGGGVPPARGNSQARGQTHITAVTMPGL